MEPRRFFAVSAATPLLLAKEALDFAKNSISPWN